MNVRHLVVSVALAGGLLAPSGLASAEPFRLAQIFNRPIQPPADVGDEEAPARSGPSASDLVVRIDRLEQLNRELTGQIEQLQFQVRKLEEQARAQPSSAAASTPPAAAVRQDPIPAPAVVGAPGQLRPTTGAEPAHGRRGDAFDPSQDPGAPGAPRQLGTTLPSAPLQQTPAGPLGAREPTGAPASMKPLDLGSAPPPPAAAPGASEPQVASIQPLGPKEEYEQASNLLKQGQYDAAEKGFSTLIAKHGKTRFAPDAIFGLGESYFQRGRHREAAEQYLKISTQFANSSKGPEAMLRLGQSLHALGAKEQACASFAEVARKYPSASSTIRAAEREAKKISC